MIHWEHTNKKELPNALLTVKTGRSQGYHNYIASLQATDPKRVAPTLREIELAIDSLGNDLDCLNVPQINLLKMKDGVTLCVVDILIWRGAMKAGKKIIEMMVILATGDEMDALLTKVIDLELVYA